MYGPIDHPRCLSYELYVGEMNIQAKGGEQQWAFTRCEAGKKSVSSGRSSGFGYRVRTNILIFFVLSYSFYTYVRTDQSPGSVCNLTNDELRRVVLPLTRSQIGLISSVINPRNPPPPCCAHARARNSPIYYKVFFHLAYSAPSFIIIIIIIFSLSPAGPD